MQNLCSAFDPSPEGTVSSGGAVLGNILVGFHKNGYVSHFKQHLKVLWIWYKNMSKKIRFRSLLTGVWRYPVRQYPKKLEILHSAWCQKIPNVSGCAIINMLITDELLKFWHGCLVKEDCSITCLCLKSNFYIVACHSHRLLICTWEKCRCHESEILYSTITAHLQGVSFDPTMSL